MKNLITNLVFMALSLPLLLLGTAVGIVLISTRLLEKWRYAAQTLREPPPLSGMYGTMARRLRGKSAECRIEIKTTATNGGRK